MPGLQVADGSVSSRGSTGGSLPSCVNHKPALRCLEESEICAGRANEEKLFFGPMELMHQLVVTFANGLNTCKKRVGGLRTCGLLALGRHSGTENKCKPCLFPRSYSAIVLLLKTSALNQLSLFFFVFFVHFLLENGSVIVPTVPSAPSPPKSGPLITCIFRDQRTDIRLAHSRCLIVM